MYAAIMGEMLGTSTRQILAVNPYRVARLAASGAAHDGPLPAP